MSKARELAELGAVYDSGALSNRNLIINGNMQIAQRGTSTSVSTSANTYLLDRFFTRIQGSSGSATVSRETDAPNGLSKSLKFTVGTADSTLDSGHYNRVHQEIEGHHIPGLKWGTADAEPASLSFWVKSSVTGTYSIGIYNGAVDRSYVSEYTISAANTWEYKTIYVAPITTGTWAIDSSAEVRITWSLGAGSTYSTGTVDQWQSAFNFSSSNNVNLMATSSATFFLTGVQFEVGPEATPFEHRNYEIELLRCQRYFYKKASLQGSVLNAYTTAKAFVDFPLPVPMRTSPTQNTMQADRFALAGVSNITSDLTSEVAYGDEFNQTMRFGNADSDFTAGLSYIIFPNSTDTGATFDAEL